MRRLALSVATAILVAGSVLGAAAVASAGTHAKPVITATQVTFTTRPAPPGCGNWASPPTRRPSRAWARCRGRPGP